MKMFLGFIAMFFMTLLAFAQVSGTEVIVIEPVVASGDFLQAFVQFLFSVKGLSTIAIAAGVVQLLILFLKSELLGKIFKGLKPAVKLSLVQGLTILSTILTVMLSGQSFSDALMSSAVLLPLQEYVFQLVKKFLLKKQV